ncbi:MAG TPA: hypothetical protein VGC93_12600 [Thermoanaerobaculia bacterium]
MRPRLALMLAVVTLFLAVSPLLAAEPTVLRVVTVQAADPGAYAKEIERGRAIMKRLGSPAQIRVWRARYAGDQAGAIVVSVEYPNLAAVAADDAKLGADAEFQSWLQGLDKVRKVVSDSLYMEVE